MAVTSLNPTPLSITPGVGTTSSPGTSSVGLDQSGGVLPGYAPDSSFNSSSSSSSSTKLSSSTSASASTTLVNPLISGFLANPAPSVSASPVGSAGGSASSTISGVSSAGGASSSVTASAAASAGGVTTSSASAVSSAGDTKPDTDFTYIVFTEPQLNDAISGKGSLQQQDEDLGNGDTWDDDPDNDYS